MKILLILILSIYSLNSFGQSLKEADIDEKLLLCLSLNENSTTQGMTNCMIDAADAYEDLMNFKYNQLLDLLTIEQKDFLIITQKEWIDFRERELSFANQLYESIGGTMWIPIKVEHRLNLTKQRTFEIDKYISILTMDL